MLKYIRYIALVCLLLCCLTVFATAEDGLMESLGFDQPMSAQEYAQKKQEFLMQLQGKAGVSRFRLARAVQSGNRLSNEYIEFAVNPVNGRLTVGTVGGNPELSSDNNQIMLFGHPNPGTSYTTVVVDGESFIYGDDGFRVAPHFADNANVSEAVFGSVVVEQRVSFVQNAATLREDVVEIRYTAKNTGSRSVNLGLRIMLDTMLGTNDSAPFRIPGTGNLTTEMEFSDGRIPQYFQAFDSLTSPRVVSHGSFYGGDIPPDRVQFANWWRAYNRSWGYSVHSGWNNDDSAVCAIWERTLAAGAEESYVIRYGLSELVQNLQPPLGLTIASNASVALEADRKGYMPYQITIYVQNLGTATAEGVIGTVNLPDDLVFDGSDLTSKPHFSIGDLAPGEERVIEKTVYVKRPYPVQEAETSFCVEVTASNTEKKTLTRHVTIPAVEGKKAIIVVPGISGSRIYAGQDVDTEEYLRDWVSQFDSLAPTYYRFHSGHMLWEPYTSTVSNSLQSITTQQDKIQSEVLMLRCNDAGSSVIQTSVSRPAADVYGAQDTYLPLMQSLVSAFFGEYDVRFFSYDWRMSNADSAESLEKYIDNSGYTQVVLVCHSMGGLVASEYLRRSEDNRQRVEKLITLGTPYLGAPKALYVLETGNFLDWATNTFCLSTPLRLVSNNIYGIYQLLPAQRYFTLNKTTYVKYYNNNGLLGEHEQKRLNYSDTYARLTGRSWARTASGGVKPMLSSANGFYENLFTGSKHIISTVDSYVVVGYGMDTIMEVWEEYNKDGSFRRCKEVTMLNGGDGTVPLISATIGGKSPRDKTYYVMEDHTGLVGNADVLKLVRNIIRGSTDCPASIQKTQPSAYRPNGWLNAGRNVRIELKLECPVTLTLKDAGGETWAYVSDNLLYNADNDKGSVYVLGENNDVKKALLIQPDNDVIINGTAEGIMNYTVSVIDCGYTVKQFLFPGTRITEHTVIYTDTDVEAGIRLSVDEDGDGTVDYVLDPAEVRVGDDLPMVNCGHLHRYDAPVFEWNSELTECTAVFTCPDDHVMQRLACTVDFEETRPATTEQSGLYTFTAAVELDGVLYQDVRTLDIPRIEAPDLPQTGDTGNLPLALAILIACGVCAVLLNVRRIPSRRR